MEEIMFIDEDGSKIFQWAIEIYLWKGRLGFQNVEINS